MEDNMAEFKSRRRYDSEFKREAVRLVIEGEKSTSSVAENLGIFPGLLYKWVKDYKEDPTNSFPGKGKLKPDDERIRQLERELVDVREERDILKKAVAIFSKAKR
jgi:transposase